MKKLYKVQCKVDMHEEIREVILFSNKSGNAIHRAICKLVDDGYFNVFPILCSEVQ